MEEERGEVCLEVEVERLYERGFSAEEISRRAGLERGWVEDVLSLLNGEENPG